MAEHTIVMRINGQRGIRTSYENWLRFKAARGLSRDTATPQRITTHRNRSAETITTAWYNPAGTTRVVTVETCAI